MARVEAYLRTKFHPNPFRRLATIDMDRKLGGGCAPLGEGVLGPQLTQYRLGRGCTSLWLLIHPENSGAVFLWGEGAGFPSNTM